MGTLSEREHEFAAVEGLLERRGEVLVIEGRAGIGKTSLVEVAWTRADGLGYEVVRARGSELEAGFAFGVVRGLDPGRHLARAPLLRAQLIPHRRILGPARAAAGHLADGPGGGQPRP